MLGRLRRWCCGQGRPGREPSAEDRALAARAVRDRLAVLEVERLDLLADESVPARKHRLDALAAARHDLVTELALLDPTTPGRPTTGCE